MDDNDDIMNNIAIINILIYIYIYVINILYEYHLLVPIVHDVMFDQIDFHS